MSGISKILTLLYICSFSCILQAQENEHIEYERSSLHIMMIKHPNQKFDDIIEDVFKSSPFPQRFNNHDLGVKVVTFAEIGGDQQANIESFIEQVALGQKMVAKWFNRDKKSGSMNMQLIKERGLYNASKSDINKAKVSIRGLALLEDAGEELIGNTYLLINDISYTSRSGKTSLLRGIASSYVGNPKELTKALNEIGGFRVNVTSYLFRLVWNDEIANTFYNKYYTENGGAEQEKVAHFKNDKDFWDMAFVGKTVSSSSETKFTGSKDAKQLLIKICTRTLDNNIAQLQKEHPSFRIKAPVVKTEPIKVYIGLKEGITEDSRFEVLERNIDIDGKTKYKRIAIIKPIKELIWDNRYMALEEDHNSNIDGTTFEQVSGGEILPGMLIREL